MPIQVYSGIKPPAQLVEEMSKRQGVARPQPQPQQNLLPPQTPSTSQPPSPLNAANTGSSASSHPIPAQDIPDAPPPSYEDAIAEDLAPVDGPRRDYQQPATTPIASPGNEKRGSDFRLQERLFDS